MRATDGLTVSADGGTFGQAILKARNELGLSQKELTTRVMTEEESGGSISPQCLDNIDSDRRTSSIPSDRAKAEPRSPMSVVTASPLVARLR